jgi:hypothetical protein
MSRPTQHPTSRRCEHCGEVFVLGRRKKKRFCTARCVALWRERLARLRRMKLPPPPPRVRRKPGRIEWKISGGQNSRGMAPTPKRQIYVPRPGSGWSRLLWRSGFRE